MFFLEGTLAGLNRYLQLNAIKTGVKFVNILHKVVITDFENIERLDWQKGLRVTQGSDVERLFLNNLQLKTVMKMYQ